MLCICIIQDFFDFHLKIVILITLKKKPFLNGQRDSDCVVSNSIHKILLLVSQKVKRLIDSVLICNILIAR